MIMLPTLLSFDSSSGTLSSMNDVTTEQKHRAIEYYAHMLSPERMETMRRVLNMRTRYITILLENIYQPHIASAILHSCDAFGIQDLHIVGTKNAYRVNPDIALGTSQWLTQKRYKSNQGGTLEAVTELKKAGYRIVATTPHTEDTNLEAFDLTAGKTAFLFGTEKEGLSAEAIESADEYMKIPMYGFVESLNISVCCALTLHTLSHELRKSDLPWQLSEVEKVDLLYSWTRSQIKSHKLHDSSIFNT